MRADRLPFALTLAAALVAGPVFGTARADDAAKVQLALKLEKDAVAAFDQSQSSVQNITMSNGMPNEQSNDTQREWTQTVESTTDGGASVQVKFGRFKGSASSMMGVMEFDSAEPADPMNPMAAFTGMFTALSGKTATVKVAKDGKLGDVTGIDGVAEAATGGMGGMGGGMVKGVARTFASPDAAKGWLRGVFPKLPEKPVGVGDTWTDEWTQDFAGGKKVKITLTFKATSIDAESVSVSLDGKFALEESAAPTTKDGEKPALPGAPGMPGLPGGPGGAGGAGGAGGGGGGGNGAPGGAGGEGGGRGGRGGAGGMTNALRDAIIEKGTMTGTAKVSRKDGMVLVQDTKTNLLLKSPSSGTTVEQIQTSHLARKAVPPAAPVVPTTPLK